MLVKLNEPAALSRIVEIISELVTEVRIKVSDFGMSIVAMDPANVAMVGFKLPKSGFSQFEADSEILGVNLDDLKRILKRVGAGSALILERKENLLEIRIEDKIMRKFTLNLIEIESEDKEMPTMEFSSSVEINSADLAASIDDCAVVADACAFIISDGKFILEAKSLNSARSEFSGDEAVIKAENCRAKYSLEYLQKFMKGAKLVEKTKIQFADDHPLKMDFRNEHMELSFILAPRVETED